MTTAAERLTVRVRALKAIAKKGELTALKVSQAIGIKHGCKPTLDQEVSRGHLRCKEGEPKKLSNGEFSLNPSAHVYEITAAGKKSLEAGTVNPVRATEAPAKAKKKAAAKKKPAKASKNAAAKADAPTEPTAAA